MKHILFWLFSLLFINNSFAQELISTSGEYHQSTDYSITWSIGEPITETVINNNYQITQGFHQTKLTITSIDENETMNLNFKVFPNPASEKIKIQTNKTDKEFEWTILDEKGAISNKGTFQNETEININSYKQGVYFLTIQNKVQLKQTFKIIKN